MSAEPAGHRSFGGGCGLVQTKPDAASGESASDRSAPAQAGGGLSAAAPPEQKTAPSEASPAASTAARGLTGKLAVLDLRNFTSDLSKQNAQYFTDVVRQETLRKEPQLEVMTRENLLVLLQATGKNLEECEVDTGRRIGADLIVSGEPQKVGTHFKISLRLYETKAGRLLGSSIASGRSIDELDENAAKAAKAATTMTAVVPRPTAPLLPPQRW